MVSVRANGNLAIGNSALIETVKKNLVGFASFEWQTDETNRQACALRVAGFKPRVAWASWSEVSSCHQEGCCPDGASSNRFRRTAWPDQQ